MSLVDITLTPKDQILMTMKSWLAETLGDFAEMMLPELGIMFLEDTPALIQEINKAIEIKDATRLKEAAHTLKGSSASMGLKEFANLCQEVESCGKTGNFGDATQKLPRLEAEYAQITALFHEII